MKIPYIGKSDVKLPENLEKPSRKEGREPLKGGEARADRIQLSKDVQKLLEMEKRFRASEGPEARAELVDRLRREIDAGVYRPDSRKVAESMIAEASKSRGED